MPRRFVLLSALFAFALLAAAPKDGPKDKPKPKPGPVSIYKHGQDSVEQPDVPQGKVTTMPRLEEPGLPRHRRATGGSTCPRSTTARRRPASWSFRTARGTSNQKGDFRVPIVFDNLIHKKEMPVTIGIFINPGVVSRRPTKAARRAATAVSSTTRCRDQYARFLEKEILPEVGKTLQAPPGRRRPGHLRHQLGRHLRLHRRLGTAGPVQQGAVSHVGSFTNIRGGDVYPGIIRKTEQKPIRVFLQDGTERPRQPARQLAAGQPADGGGAEVQEVRLPVRHGRRRPQRQARRRHPAGLAALAVGAGGEEVKRAFACMVLLGPGRDRRRSGHAARA